MTPAAMTPAAMTVVEFADAVRLPRSTAYRRIADGDVEVTNVGTKDRPRLRITQEALKAYLDRHRVPAAPKRSGHSR